MNARPTGPSPADAGLKPLYGRIYLAKNVYALLDYDDAVRCARHNWQPVLSDNTIYARTESKTIGADQRLMHRYVLKPRYKVGVDHRNGNGLDNRRHNLRIATSAENSRNSYVADIPHKTSRFKGVHWNRDSWVATITLEGEKQWIGQFDDEDAAARAYDEAALRLFGEFARTNAMMGLFGYSERRNDGFADLWGSAWPVLETPEQNDGEKWSRKRHHFQSRRKRLRRHMIKKYHETLS